MRGENRVYTELVNANLTVILKCHRSGGNTYFAEFFRIVARMGVYPAPKQVLAEQTTYH